MIVKKQAQAMEKQKESINRLGKIIESVTKIIESDYKESKYYINLMQLVEIGTTTIELPTDTIHSIDATLSELNDIEQILNIINKNELHTKIYRFNGDNDNSIKIMIDIVR